jgi:quercetin dioxygenase-like cupin family protein
MPRSTSLVLAVFLALPPCATAQQKVAEIDPAVVSPNMYTVRLENAHVRVVEYVIGPGQRDNWHTHPPKVSYVLSGGSLRITAADGESFDVHEETGSTTWFEAVGKHYGQNIGTTPVRVLLVEIKAATQR